MSYDRQVLTRPPKRVKVNSPAGSSYTMDAADRLTGAPLPGGVSQSLNDDAAGELTTSTAGSASYTYGYNDPSGNHTGNRTSRTDQLGTKLSYSYDQLNRLTGFNATRPNSWLPARNYTYAVNGDGLRMSKAIDGVGNGGYAWDVAEGLPLLLQDGSTAYITGPGGLPMEQVTGSTVDYYQPDQLGSTRLVTDGSAQVSDAYSYDSYGNLVSSQVAQPNPFMFTGQYQDIESGLYYLRARYYDPATGQFLSRDPMVAKTRQPYGYTDDNPLNGTDPTGLDFWSGLQTGLIWVGEHLPGPARDAYVSGLSAAGNRAGDDQARLQSGDPGQMVQPVLDALTVASAVTGVYGLGRAAVGCAAARLGGEAILEAPKPLPPGWTEEWEQMYGTRGGYNWFDKQGGEWRLQEADQWHAETHWDYNPWTEWNSPWQNVPLGGN